MSRDPFGSNNHDKGKSTALVTQGLLSHELTRHQAQSFGLQQSLPFHRKLFAWDWIIIVFGTVLKDPLMSDYFYLANFIWKSAYLTL